MRQSIQQSTQRKAALGENVEIRRDEKAVHELLQC